MKARLQADIEFLASDSLGGRPAGSVYERLAADYIVARFEEAGLKTRRLPFEIDLEGDSTLASANLLTFLDSGADSTIVICAHYDHLGLGSGKSLELRFKGIHPGADDNASGVAMVLELARWLAGREDRSYNYVFLSTSAHEIGLFGAQAVVDSGVLADFKVKRFLNLDMVGRLDPRGKMLRLSHCPEAPELASLAKAVEDENLRIRVDVDQETVNDFTIFCEAGFPTLSLGNGLHEDYHRIGDVPSKINYPGMLSILGFCKVVVSP